MPSQHRTDALLDRDRSQRRGRQRLSAYLPPAFYRLLSGDVPPGVCEQIFHPQQQQVQWWQSGK